MAEPFIGEIQAFGFGYAPINWMICNGASLSIQKYSALYSLIGTYYGGNGSTTFNLPNLVGFVAMGQGQGPGLTQRAIGEVVGQPTVSLSTPQLPSHAHAIQLGPNKTANATPGPSAASNVALDPNFNGFVAPPATTTFAPSAITMAGGSQPHPNAQPTLALVYCICVAGNFPSFG